MDNSTNASAAFARWLHDALVARDYDLGMRGGGKQGFADASGIPRPTVSRMLAGRQQTDPATLSKVAAALKVPFVEVLVEAGVVTPAEVEAIRTPSGSRRLTAEQAADELGITDQQARIIFGGLVETLQRQQQQQPGDAGSATGG